MYSYSIKMFIPYVDICNIKKFFKKKPSLQLLLRLKL